MSCACVTSRRILKEESEEFGLSAAEIARQIDVPPHRSGQIMVCPEPDTPGP
jgi:plasmid maintenance system antidote protein VapI